MTSRILVAIKHFDDFFHAENPFDIYTASLLFWSFKLSRISWE